MSLRAFDTLWQCGGQEVGRQIIEAEDMDAALVSAWIRMPAISRSGHKPCDTIRITDMISGRELVEDVPPFSPPPVRIAKAVSIFVLGCVGLFVAIWMARHGQYESRSERKLLVYCIMALPMAFVFAVITGAMSYKERQEAIAQWKKDFGDLRPAVGPDNPRLARVIVARFSVWRQGLSLLLGLAFIIAGICIPLASRLSDGHWALWQPLVWAASAALFLAYLPPLRQFLFDGRAALWIEGGELVHCHRLAQSVPIWSIAGVSVEKYKPPKGFAYDVLMLTSKHGDSAPIARASILSEPAEKIAARLNGLLQVEPQPFLRAIIP